MAARTPRKTFASPFVVTLAVAPACYTSTAPPPPPPSEPAPAQPAPSTVVVNPPRPQDPPPPDPGQRPVMVNPPRPIEPQDRPVMVNPPRPTDEPAPAPQQWTLLQRGGSCEAIPKVDCPQPQPGHPHITCNPPPPIPYACPEGVDLKTPRTIITVADGCRLETEAMKCPPHVMCNPPPPKAVPCPHR